MDAHVGLILHAAVASTTVALLRRIFAGAAALEADPGGPDEPAGPVAQALGEFLFLTCDSTRTMALMQPVKPGTYADFAAVFIGALQNVAQWQSRNEFKVIANAVELVNAQLRQLTEPEGLLMLAESHAAAIVEAAKPMLGTVVYARMLQDLISKKYAHMRRTQFALMRASALRFLARTRPERLLELSGRSETSQGDVDGSLVALVPQRPLTRGCRTPLVGADDRPALPAVAAEATAALTRFVTRLVAARDDLVVTPPPLDRVPEFEMWKAASLRETVDRASRNVAARTSVTPAELVGVSHLVAPSTSAMPGRLVYSWLDSAAPRLLELPIRSGNLANGDSAADSSVEPRVREVVIAASSNGRRLHATALSSDRSACKTVTDSIDSLYRAE